MPSRNRHMPTAVWAWWCLLLLGASTTALAQRARPAAQQVTCPNVEQGVCTAACQEATCAALADFYNATYNANKAWETTSWGSSNGWALTTTQSCASILAARGSSPSYCSWYGIRCCQPADVATQQCSTVHAVRELKVQVNGLNASLDSPGVINNLLQLHACGLTKLNLQGNDLSGSMTDAWGQLTNLTVLDLANNWINGTIPTALRSLKRLQTLSLGTNFLAGPIPHWLGELQDLQALNLGANAGRNPDGSEGLTGTLPRELADLPRLSVLNVETNALVGTLPPQLCQRSKLTVLKLRANQFTGVPFQLMNCTYLTQLDISSNRFGGPLPPSSMWNWTQLAVLDASSNQFVGTIPDALYTLPVIGYLSLANNRLTGRIKRAITLMTYLTELSLGHNQLTGEIDENLWFLPQLRTLDLSHNKLTGTLSPAVGLTFGLQELLLDNNMLSGPIPPEMGILKHLKDVDTRNTSLSCLGSSSSSTSSTSSPSHSSSGAAVQQCAESQLLPCFLQFSEITLPRTDNSNMACPIIMRRLEQEALRRCSGDGPMQLAEQAANLPDVHEEQVWDVDPSYYQYRSCRCLEGFTAVWQRNHTLLTCEPQGFSVVPVWVLPFAIVMSVAAAMLLAAAALLVWLRMAVQLRPRWQREKELNENRKKGVPNGGPATIVVTDIEKYSELMQVNAALTTRALGIHNAILRRAAAAHAGHVVEQEGDSWSVAFHTPMDAVAFCLQVQQALEKTNWKLDVDGRSRSSARAARESAGAGNSTVDGSYRGGSGSSNIGPAGQHSHSWLHGMSASVLVGSGSSGIAAAAAAGLAGAGSGPLPALAAAARPFREVKSAVIMTMTNLDEGHEESEEDPALGGLLSLREQSNSSSDMLASTLDNHRTTSFDRRTGLSSSVARLQQMLGQAHETSFSSRQSSHSSLISCRSSGSKGAAANGVILGGLNSTPSSSVMSMLQGLRVRLANLSSGSGGTATDQLGRGLGPSGNSGSFTGAGVAAEAAAAGVSNDAVGSRGLSLVRTRTSAGSTAATTVTLGQANQQGSASRFWSIIGFTGGRGNQGQAGGSGVHGLRVRMGVASGFVPRNTNIARCAVFELAKAVSDMANGGQVLLEAGCFADVRDRLTELGTVDHRGYNDKLLASATKAVMRQQTSCIFNCLGWLKQCLGYSIDGNSLDTDALLLDMGEYHSPSLANIIPSAAGETVASSTDPLLGPPAADDAAIAAAAAAIARCSSSSGGAAASGTNTQLQLYSILPRSLQSRAKIWMNRLSFREATQQIGRGYFDAPGAGVADLCTSAVDPDRSPLPAVTMVFAAVEGGRLLVRRRAEVGRTVHNAISRIMQVLLLALPERDGQRDGYLCRQQEGELKYMLAFREPARALEWCLLVQEVMQHVPWPMEVLDEFEAVAAAATDKEHFGGSFSIAALPAAAHGGTGSSSCLVHATSRSRAGPSLKMGLAEGEPHLILPDHLGRADYHGQSVNLAARMMDAAARGGQVVTTAELADRIFCTWRFESELGLYDLPDRAPSLQQDTAAAAAAVMQQRSQQQQELVLPEAPSPIQQQQGRSGSSSCKPSRPAATASSDGHSAGSSSGFMLPCMSQEGAAGAETPRVASPSPAAFGSAVVAGGAGGAGGSGSGAAAAGGGGGGGGSGSVRMRPSLSRQELLREIMQRSSMLVDPPEYPHRLVHVSSCHIGTWAFKGCGALDIVTFSSDALPQAYDFCTSAPKGGKGTLLFPRSGPVVGQQDCPIVLPEVLPVLERAWGEAAAAAAAAEHTRQLRKQAATSSYMLFRDVPDMQRNDAAVLNARALAGSIKRLFPQPSAGASVAGVSGGSAGSLPAVSSAQSELLCADASVEDGSAREADGDSAVAAGAAGGGEGSERAVTGLPASMSTVRTRQQQQQGGGSSSSRRACEVQLVVTDTAGDVGAGGASGVSDGGAAGSRDRKQGVPYPEDREDVNVHPA